MPHHNLAVPVYLVFAWDATGRGFVVFTHDYRRDCVRFIAKQRDGRFYSIFKNVTDLGAGLHVDGKDVSLQQPEANTAERTAA